MASIDDGIGSRSKVKEERSARVRALQTPGGLYVLAWGLWYA